MSFGYLDLLFLLIACFFTFLAFYDVVGEVGRSSYFVAPDTSTTHGTVTAHQGAPPDPASPPASVTGQPGLSGKPADSPPVAGDGGETG